MRQVCKVQEWRGAWWSLCHGGLGLAPALPAQAFPLEDIAFVWMRLRQALQDLANTQPTLVPQFALEKYQQVVPRLHSQSFRQVRPSINYKAIYKAIRTSIGVDCFLSHVLQRFLHNAGPVMPMATGCLVSILAHAAGLLCPGTMGATMSIHQCMTC